MENDKKGGNKNKGNGVQKVPNFLFYVLSLILIVFISFVFAKVNSAKIAMVGNEVKDEETKEVVKLIDATILDTEAIAGNSVYYNTYFKLSDGSILKIEDDNVYTYAKFNEGAKVKVEVKEGIMETEVKDIYGNVISEEVEEKGNEIKDNQDELKSNLYRDKYKYISDVLVDGKSIRFID